MGPATPHISRLGFLLCIDGIPAFHGKHKGAPTLEIAELIPLFLPPEMRYDPDNMFCWALIPEKMKASEQLKYFDYIVNTELNPLQEHGFLGPDGLVKVKLFGASLDLKAKEKFYNQISVQAYCGCSTCGIKYDAGPGGPIYAAARLMLPADSPLRNRVCVCHGQRFFFRNQENRRPARIKTTQTLFNCATRARQLSLEHFLGQKGFPLFRNLRGWQYDKFNLLEWMHNMARAFDNFQNLLVGNGPEFDRRSRNSCRVLNLFPEVWPTEVQYLTQVDCC